MLKNYDVKKQVTVDSTVLLQGIVKAIFKDNIHVQIGGKVISLPITEVNIAK
ncbi:hypothetical protein IMZ08_06275 [Bacillus luteolus]|uniref:Uncharacterized protein n=1 Tax=Litchfieldia luteola TaxID=682179 RepID=A0ABR9QGM9_9BACI|nr:hypothetical protein [Cytobacillus luteolus]MBE4907657.1 hypothetical protein [Cytobacillus luteolus]MBP1941108.1 hypothetical protein [Cytobacillus luteolus]